MLFAISVQAEGAEGATGPLFSGKRVFETGLSPTLGFPPSNGLAAARAVATIVMITISKINIIFLPVAPKFFLQTSMVVYIYGETMDS